MSKVPTHQRPWAHDLEEQEEFHNDPVTARLRAHLTKEAEGQRARLLAKCRTALSLEDVRYEAGFLEGLMSAITELVPADG